MNLIDPNPSRAFRTVAVGVLVRVLAGCSAAEDREEDAAREEAEEGDGDHAAIAFEAAR